MNQLSEKKKSLLFNLGAASSYFSQICLLTHVFHLIITQQKAHVSNVGFAAFALTSIILMAPYKWDRKWQRRKTKVGMAVFTSVLIGYLICFLEQWVLPLSN